MRLNCLVVSASCVLILCAQFGESTLMLTSLMMAAQTGMLLGKMSVGGLLMMLMAAQQQGSQSSYGGARSASSGLGSLTGAASGTTKRRYRRAKRETEPELDPKEEKIERDRMVRQIDSAFDSLTCLPKFVCGLNAAPPSKKTSLLNDYGHLLKVIVAGEVTGDDADDDLEESEEEETRPKTDEEYRLALKEKDKLKEMANEEIIEEDPSMLSYVLKDVVQDMTFKKNPNRQSPSTFETYRPAFGGVASDSDESASSASSFSPLKTIVSAFRLPALKLKTSGTSDASFDKDPFFAGFKRSMRDLKSRPAHDYITEDQPAFASREERAAYMVQKKKQLEEVTDPVQKYQIAEEIGKKTRKQEDCAAAFKKCPYEWDQVMSMVNNLRQNVMNRPGSLLASPPKIVADADKVVFLKTSTGNVASGIPLNLSPNDNGVTTVTHDLGNGNTVEIQMKLYKIHKKNHNNVTQHEDDELEADTPLSGSSSSSASAEPMFPKNATILSVQEIVDDELEQTAEIDSAMKIFQAINSGKMKPLKKKNPFVVVPEGEPGKESPTSNKSKEDGKNSKVKVSEDDKSVTITLLQKDKNKDEEQTTSEEDDDEADDELLGFRNMIIRPSSSGSIGAKFTKDRAPGTTMPPSTKPTTQSPNHPPTLGAPLLTRRRLPGTTPNFPRRKHYRSVSNPEFVKL